MKSILLTILLLISFLSLKAQNITNKQNMEPKQEVYQLRIYKLFEWNKEQFYTRFKDHAIRIMKKYDFEIIKMWETNSNNIPEFVYILKWDDEKKLKKSWTEFMADEEWKKIKDETHSQYGYMVGGIEDRTLFKSPIE